MPNPTTPLIEPLPEATELPPAGAVPGQSDSASPTELPQWLVPIAFGAPIVVTILALAFASLVASTDATVVVAAITLTGTVFTAIGTLVGVLISDRRAELEARRIEAENTREHNRLVAEQNREYGRLVAEKDREHDRLIAEKQREDQRLRVETALKAAQMFSDVELGAEGNASPGDKAKVAGVLWALVNLGRVDLAIAQLSDLWPAGMVTLRTTGLLLERAVQPLDPPEPHNLWAVIDFLSKYADTLADGNEFEWPTPFDKALPADAPLELRENCLRAFYRQAAAPQYELSRDRFLITLDNWHTAEPADDEGQLRTQIGTDLKTALVTIPPADEDTLTWDNRSVSVVDLQEHVDQYQLPDEPSESLQAVLEKLT